MVATKLGHLNVDDCAPDLYRIADVEPSLSHLLIVEEGAVRAPLILQVELTGPHEDQTVSPRNPIFLYPDVAPLGSAYGNGVVTDAHPLGRAVGPNDHQRIAHPTGR